MKLRDHKGSAFILIVLLAGVVCFSCGSCSGIDNENTNEVVVAPEIDQEANLQAVVNAGNTEVEAETTFADVAMRLLDDTLFRWSLIAMLITGCVFVIYSMVAFAVIIHGFHTGNIDPRKPKQKKTDNE